jgi:hypothetical protein
MAKKGQKVGPRIIVEWGTIKKKTGGKTVAVKLTSQVVKTTADLFGLKESKAGGSSAVTKNITTKKGKRLILSGGVSKVATRKMFASTDGKVFHQLPVPAGLSLAKAYSVFKAGKKAYEIKFQGGTSRIIGKPTKDTKTKSKAADKTAK